jgi:hypothetical protein
MAKGPASKQRRKKRARQEHGREGPAAQQGQEHRTRTAQGTEAKKHKARTQTRTHGLARTARITEANARRFVALVKQLEDFDTEGVQVCEFELRTRLLRRLASVDCAGFTDLKPVCAILAALTMQRWFA